MISRDSTLGRDDKTWWRQEASTTQHHLKNWKVLLWVVASLLTLVEDVFSEDSKVAQSDMQRVLRQPSWSPAEDLEQESSVHIPRPDAFEPLEYGKEELGSTGASLLDRCIEMCGNDIDYGLVVTKDREQLHAEEFSLLKEEEIHQDRWRRSSREPHLPRTSRRNRKKTKSSRDCHLERKEMRVRDLGLGYDSDEIILFKYCVGTCHSSRRNYDLALKTLMDNGSISGKKVSGHPCCRPTRYETVSFMDTQTTWQTIKWLSAANCSCVG